jgi:hypothetical protein
MAWDRLPRSWNVEPDWIAYALLLLHGDGALPLSLTVEWMDGRSAEAMDAYAEFLVNVWLRKKGLVTV